MPTNLQITLDAAQYQQQLDKVVSETRNAAKNMTNTLNVTGKGLDKSITVPIKTSGGELKKYWKNLRQEFNNFSNSAKTLTNTVSGGSGGAIGIIATGALSAFKLVQYYYGLWASHMKEVAEMSERNAKSIAEAAAINEKYRQSGESAMQKLSALSNVEKLSNVQKNEAVTLIAQLNKQYGDLGIRIDRTTGKIIGLNRAMSVKFQQNKEKRLHEIDAQIQQLTVERNEQEKIISSESFWSRLFNNGKEKTAEASQKRTKIDHQLRELRIQRDQLLQSNPRADFLAQQAGVNADIEAQTRQREKDFAKRKLQDKINNSDAAGKMELISREIIYEQKNRSQLEEAFKKAKNKYHSVTNAGDRVDAEREMVDARAKVQQSEERIYDWQQQLNMLKKTENEAKALQEQEEQEEQRKFQETNRNKAQELKWQALEMSGRGRDAAREKAVREAEMKSGRKLSADERGKVEQLSDLTWDLNHRGGPPNAGDLSIRTNSLTSRGGFSGGAVMPDSEKIAREACNYNKRQAETADKIMRFLEELGRN